MLQIEQITFNGYKHRLKTLWRRGKLPNVVRGFYGDILTQKNISLEHLRPHSKGGRTTLENLVLASKEKNNLRGSAKIERFVNKQTVLDYLSQFVNVRAKDFDGNLYINLITRTLKSLGLDLLRK